METLVDEPALVLVACEPVGQVKVRGEVWRARAATPVPSGGMVRITSVDGLALEVEPLA